MCGLDPAAPVEESGPAELGSAGSAAGARQRGARPAWRWRTAAAVWLAFVWWGLESPPSSLPSLPRLPLLPWIPSDVVAHGILFWMTAWLLHRAVIHRRSLTAALLAAIAYGLITELHQLRVPGRATELADLLSNASGSSLYAAGAWWRRR